jgi:glycosyltransferase involved in cell wall biosynthesis
VEAEGAVLSPKQSIDPVPEGIARPFWSVMMPTYNVPDYFEQTLRSVLDQDPGHERMEVVVIDNVSTNGRSEAVVRRLAPGRIEFHRQPVHVSLAANWNTCVARSRGHWVHILHADDLVLPGFYERLARAAEHPEVGAAFCRHISIDGKNRQLDLSGLEQPSSGILTNWLQTISQDQRIQCPSIVVRRNAYEHLGGFRSDLCFALDWEMWVRIAASYAVWYEPEPLACYRNHEANETSRLRRLGLIFADVQRAIDITSRHLPAELQSKVGHEILATHRNLELGFTNQAFSEGDVWSGMANLRRAIKYDPSLRFSRRTFSYYKWALKIWFAWLLSSVRSPRSTCPSNNSGRSHLPKNGQAHE